MSADWSNLPDQVLEELSAYADGELGAEGARRLEQQIRSDSSYRAALDMFRQTKAILSTLPEEVPPRSYRLTPEMAGMQARRPWLPTRQLATVLTAAVLAFTVGLDVFSPSTNRAGAMLETDLRAQEMPGASQFAATPGIEMQEEAESVEGQVAEEPAAELEASGDSATPSSSLAPREGAAGEDIQPSLEAADELSQTTEVAAGALVGPTEAVDEFFRDGGQAPDLATERMSVRSRLVSFVRDRIVLRSVEILLGILTLALAVSLLFRP